MPVEIVVLIASFAFLAGSIVGKAVERKDWVLTARSHGRHFANGHWYSVMDEATASQYRIDAHKWRLKVRNAD